MTLREIVDEIYKENKRFILFYITLLVIFATGFVYNNRSQYEGLVQTHQEVYAVQSIEMSAETSVPVVTKEQGAVMGGETYSEINVISRSMGTSIDPLTILGFEAIIALMANIMPESWGQYADGLGLMSSSFAWPVILLLFIVCLVLKFLKSNNYTKVGGLVIEDVENKIGVITGPVLTFIAWVSGKEVAYAASLAGQAQENVHTPVISVVWIVMLTVVASVMYYIVRTVIYSFEIISLTFSLVPMSSCTIEMIKMIVALFMILVAKSCPELVVVVFGIIFIICLILFKKAYMVVRYFKTIYILPIFKKKKESLIEVGKAEKLLGNTNGVKVFLPMFSRTVFNPKVGKYSKCWLLVTNEDIVVCKKKLFSKELQYYWLMNGESRFFIQNNMRFIEIFTIPKEKEDAIHSRFWPLKRNIHFIISREYSKQYALLEQILPMTNYREYQKGLRALKKEEKQMMRRRRTE